MNETVRNQFESCWMCAIDLHGSPFPQHLRDGDRYTTPMLNDAYAWFLRGAVSATKEEPES